HGLTDQFDSLRARLSRGRTACQREQDRCRKCLRLHLGLLSRCIASRREGRQRSRGSRFLTLLLLQTAACLASAGLGYPESLALVVLKLSPGGTERVPERDIGILVRRIGRMRAADGDLPAR